MQVLNECTNGAGAKISESLGDTLDMDNYVDRNKHITSDADASSEIRRRNQNAHTNQQDQRRLGFTKSSGNTDGGERIGSSRDEVESDSEPGPQHNHVGSRRNNVKNDSEPNGIPQQHSGPVYIGQIEAIKIYDISLNRMEVGNASAMPAEVKHNNGKDGTLQHAHSACCTRPVMDAREPEVKHSQALQASKFVPNICSSSQPQISDYLNETSEHLRSRCPGAKEGDVARLALMELVASDSGLTCLVDKKSLTMLHRGEEFFTVEDDSADKDITESLLSLVPDKKSCSQACSAGVSSKTIPVVKSWKKKAKYCPSYRLRYKGVFWRDETDECRNHKKASAKPMNKKSKPNPRETFNQKSAKPHHAIKKKALNK